MYSTAYNLWTFTWFVHFELPFRLKGTEKIHTERFFLFLSNIYSFLYADKVLTSILYCAIYKVSCLSVKWSVLQEYTTLNCSFCSFENITLFEVLTLQLKKHYLSLIKAWRLYILPMTKCITENRVKNSSVVPSRCIRPGISILLYINQYIIFIQFRWTEQIYSPCPIHPPVHTAVHNIHTVPLYWADVSPLAYPSSCTYTITLYSYSSVVPSRCILPGISILLYINQYIIFI